MDEPHHDERQDLAGVAARGASAVSWAAVLAGAAAAGAVSLLLFALTSGLDLAALSSNLSAPLGALARSTAIALIVTQWISAGLGGYITGRLRTRWVGTHTHEVFFRDTAHGFLTWCVATLFLASGLVSVGAHVLRDNVAAHTPAAMSDSAQGALHGELLLRLTPTGSAGAAMAPDASPDGATASERAARGEGKLLLPEGPDNTRDSGMTFLARLAPAPGARDARQQEEAQDVAGQGTDAERRNAATISIFTALSMLVGAFVASVSAALGGKLRDLHP